MFILGNGGIGWRGCIVEMFHLKIIPLFSCFKRVTCFFTIFVHRWWNLWYPFFLFISETTFPLPSKGDMQRPLGYASAILSFLNRDDLPPQHDWLCHRQPNNNKLFLKKRRLQFTQDYLLHFILPYFYVAFHSKLQRVTEHPLFMTTILLKDCSLSRAGHSTSCPRSPPVLR